MFGSESLMLESWLRLLNIFFSNSVFSTPRILAESLQDSAFLGWLRQIEGENEEKLLVLLLKTALQLLIKTI